MKIKHRNLLDEKQISNLEQGKMYGVYAEPGSGKTYMIKTALMEYCRKKKKTALYLVHRITLKKQTLADVEQEIKKMKAEFFGNGFTVMTYQSIEYCYKHNIFHKVQPFLNSDFIVCDEAHYFMSDSWNEQTDYSVQFMEDTTGVKLFMTGTPKEMRVLERMWEIETLVNVNRQNNNLKAIRIYERDSDLIEHINQYASETCKVFSFVSGKTENVLALKNAHGGSFVVSKHNEYFAEADKNYIDIVVKGEGGKQKGIVPSLKAWSTSVWNEGVNVIDPHLSVICSFRPRSSTEFIQQFARARRSDILGCIVAPTRSMLQGYKQKCEDELIALLYCEARRSNSKFMKMREYSLIETIRETEIMLEMGFGQYVQSIYTDIAVYDYGQIIRDQKIAKYLEVMVDVKMFAEQQEHFKQMMIEEYGFRTKNRSKKLGINSFNEFLQEGGIQFELISKRESSRKSEHFSKAYWKVLRKNVQSLYIDLAQKNVAPDISKEPDFEKQISAFKFKPKDEVSTAEVTNLMTSMLMNKRKGAV